MTATVDITGVAVDALTETELVDRIIDWATSGLKPRSAVGLNAHLSNQCARDPRLRELVQSAETVYADGVSILYAARLLGGSLPQRLATTDIIEPLAAAAAAAGLRMFFFGARPGVAEEAAQRLQQIAPGVLISTEHGFASDEDAVVTAINDSGAAILVIGLGDPLQQEWVARNRDRLNVGAVLTAGGLFDWISGRNRRAPAWMIKAGLEWLWRLIIEPRRLASRYLMGNPQFVARVVAQRLRRR